MGDDERTATNIYQLAGVDDRERGFNRQVQVRRTVGERVQAVLRYEALLIEGEAADTEDAALEALVRALHARGYRQIRTQLIFRGDRYLGSQEPWKEYADAQASPASGGLRAWLNRILRRSST